MTMLTPEELEEVMKKIKLYSYDTDVVVNDSEGTYSPSECVCDIDNIYDILKDFTSPF